MYDNDMDFSYTFLDTPIKCLTYKEFLFENGITNVHEAEEEDIFVEMIKNISTNGCFVNIGSAIGYYPLLAKILAPNINIYAIEPLERHRKHFSENIELNGFNKNAFAIYKERISEVTGKSKFVDSGYGSAIISNNCTTKNALTIQTITLDDLIEKIGCAVDFLQMDVQGFEVDVLRGAQQTLKLHSVKRFLIGTHNKKLHQECITILKQHEYYVNIDKFETIEQPDGIILATLDK